MKISFLGVVLSLTVTSLYAAPGFFNPTDPRLPPHVKAAADSVFEIRASYLEDYENFSDVRFFDVSTPAKRQEVMKAFDSTSADNKDKQIYKAYIQNCKTKEEVQECGVPLKINSGSAFITGKGNTLWTNAHVLEKTVKAKAATNEKTLEQLFKSKDTMPFFLFDKNGKMVFNGLNSQVTFKAVPGQTALAKHKGEFYAEDSDYLALTLPKAIGKPLKVAKNIMNDDVAVIGYPTCTGCDTPEGMDQDEFASRYPYQDAEDCLEKVTGGKLLSPQSWASLAQVNQSLLNFIDKNQFIGHTADSHYGMSGGPMLNFNGEVIGIHAGGKSIKKGQGFERVSRGIRPPELFLEP